MRQADGRQVVGQGRYIGSNGRYWCELRVDSADVGVVSGELQSTGPEDGAGYASFKTVKDARGAADCQETDLDWTDATGATHASGTVTVRHSEHASKGAVHIALELAADIGGLPAGTVEIEATYAGTSLREIGLEITSEDGVVVAGLEESRHAGGPPSLTERVVGSLRRAGLGVTQRPGSVVLPRPDGGWSESEIFAKLNEAMKSTARGGLNRPDWDLHLLLLSGTDRGGLLGLMFDLDGPLPRQGAAVFVDTIRSSEPDRTLAETKILHAAMHELGHALNLRHRFGRDVRRSTSRSVMNYDWQYRGGQKESEYWHEFGEGAFDADELAFLRHAPRFQVVPGGSPFGSAVYWETGSAGTAAEDPPWRDLRLWLTPPRAGSTFAYGQPVFVEVSLLNMAESPVCVPRHALDIKGALLDIEVRRRAGDAPQAEGASMFTPMMQRCFHVDRVGQVQLRYGDSMHANANLFYGASGSTFSDPGDYELTPVLTFPADDAAPDHLVVGPPLQIHVAAPQSRAEERDGEVLLGRSDVGAALALGGSTCLQAAAGELEDIRNRREREAAVTGRPDPVVAALARCAGISAGRSGQTTWAAELLSQATRPEAITSFDPHTAQHTRRLAAKYRGELTAAKSAMVVVDLWSRPRTGWPTVGGRGSGFLVSRGAPSGGSLASSGQRGWGVLAPAWQLPAESMDAGNDVGAVVTITSEDGLTERMSAARVDLIAGGDGAGPALALIELSHPVPSPLQDVLLGPVDDPSAPGQLSEFFGREGTETAEVASWRGADLNDWADAAEDAIAAAPRPHSPTAPIPARVHPYPEVDPAEVAIKWCRLTGRCLTGPPPPDDIDTPYTFTVVRRKDRVLRRKVRQIKSDAQDGR